MTPPPQIISQRQLEKLPAARAPRCPVSILPPEVFAHVLDRLSDDRQTLQAARLVNRSWNESVREAFFRHVTIEPYQNGVHSVQQMRNLSALLAADPSISGLITELTLSFHSSSDWADDDVKLLVELLAQLGSVRTLNLRASGGALMGMERLPPTLQDAIVGVMTRPGFSAASISGISDLTRVLPLHRVSAQLSFLQQVEYPLLEAPATRAGPSGSNASSSASGSEEGSVSLQRLDMTGLLLDGSTSNGGSGGELTLDLSELTELRARLGDDSPEDEALGRVLAASSSTLESYTLQAGTDASMRDREDEVHSHVLPLGVVPSLRRFTLDMALGGRVSIGEGLFALEVLVDAARAVERQGARSGLREVEVVVRLLPALFASLPELEPGETEADRIQKLLHALAQQGVWRALDEALSAPAFGMLERVAVVLVLDDPVPDVVLPMRTIFMGFLGGWMPNLRERLDFQEGRFSDG